MQAPNRPKSISGIRTHRLTAAQLPATRKRPLFPLIWIDQDRAVDFILCHIVPGLSKERQHMLTIPPKGSLAPELDAEHQSPDRAAEFSEMSGIFETILSQLNP